MVAIARVLARTFSSGESTETFQVLTVFCLAGLLACLLVANYAANLDFVWPEINF